MQQVKILAAVLIGITLTAFSCGKDDDNKTTCVGGTGGDLTIVVFPQHHGKTIYNQDDHLDTVFVKYNTVESPGQDRSDYDTIFVGEAGEDHVHVKGLKCGKYYLFAAGYDTSIFQRVIGGVPYTTDKSSGEIDLNVPVTEGD